MIIRKLLPTEKQYVIQAAYSSIAHSTELAHHIVWFTLIMLDMFEYIHVLYI